MRRDDIPGQGKTPALTQRPIFDLKRLNVFKNQLLAAFVTEHMNFRDSAPMGFQIKSDLVTSFRISDPFSESVMVQFLEKFLPLTLSPGMVTAKPTVEFTFGEADFLFAFHLSLLSGSTNGCLRKHFTEI